MDSGNLKKISRCADIVNTCTSRLLGVSNSDYPNLTGPGLSSIHNGSAMDLKSESSESSSVLSDAQMEILDQAGSDVKGAIEALTNVVKHNLTSQLTNLKMRRMLPVTPVGKGLNRCNSAKSPRRLPRPLSLIEFGKSNEL